MNSLVLASASPRRRELLEGVGIRFRVSIPKVDETPRRGEQAQALVRRLSYQKALDRLEHSKKGSTILAADTVVVLKGKKGDRILGKPRSKREAISMLKALSAKTHRVLTGYTLLQEKGRTLIRVTRVVRTSVQMRRISQAEIRQYVRTGEPMDKAGAYAAQGCGMALIERLSGSYSNVVGLPLCEVVKDLCQHFSVKWPVR